jgi:hypothetical protein
VCVNNYHEQKLIKETSIVIFDRLISEAKLSAYLKQVKGKAIQLQALTGPEGSRRFRFPDFKTIGT